MPASIFGRTIQYINMILEQELLTVHGALHPTVKQESMCTSNSLFIPHILCTVKTNSPKTRNKTGGKHGERLHECNILMQQHLKSMIAMTRAIDMACDGLVDTGMPLICFLHKEK